MPPTSQLPYRRALVDSATACLALCAMCLCALLGCSSGPSPSDGCTTAADGTLQCPDGSDPSGGGKADGMGTDPHGSLYRAGNRFGWGGKDPFVDNVLPVFARRCATCHGCIDSPCQLKMTSYDELVRGSNVSNIFGKRIFETAPTRVQDGRLVDREGVTDTEASVEQWRSEGFYSVVDGAQQSVMYQLLDDAHKRIPEGGLSRAHDLYEAGLKTRNFECVGPESSGRTLSDAVLAPRAMPLGCPAIDDGDWQQLAQWLIDGAKGPSHAAQLKLAQPMRPDVVARWEELFNQPGAKAAIASRFIFEHAFTARIQFPEAPGDYFELVRSFTPPGQGIVEAVTVRANDSPSTSRFQLAGGDPNVIYYRFRKFTAIIVEKNHITWTFDEAAMKRFKELLFDSAWGSEPVQAPAYGTYNPFYEFRQIPSDKRATFMAEFSYPLIDAMVRGDVCHGSTATYAIRDHFWVWFLDPAADPSAHDPRLGLYDWQSVMDPSQVSSFSERSYLSAFEDRLRELRPGGLGLSDLWTGGNAPENAQITVLRHNTTATATRGAFNGVPGTFWILSFANFERLYYALVVNFNPWGSLTHRLDTWTYMSFIRADGEDLFLSLLPEQYRKSTRDQWTSSFGRIKDELLFDMESAGRPSAIKVDSKNPLGDLVRQITSYMGEKVTGTRDPINVANPSRTLPESIKTHAELEAAFSTLTGWKQPFVQYLPNLTVLRADGEVYTMVANRGYAYHNSILAEDLSRRPEQDTLSIDRGLVGSRPELFIDLPLGKAQEFLSLLRAVDSELEWNELVDRTSAASYGDVHMVLRDQPQFWPFLDFLHDWNVTHNPVTAGLLDVSEYVWPPLVAPGVPLADDAMEPNDEQESSVPLSDGRTRLVLCEGGGGGWFGYSGRDWFELTVDRPGTLAIELAFDPQDGTVDAQLTVNGERVLGETGPSYDAFLLQVTPGNTYKLGVLGSPSTCQNYTVYASLH
jgi:hypothetical protein